MLFVLRQFYSGKDYMIACIIYLVALVISFTLHEFAHAFTAYKSGDVTPKNMGRVTLNPLAHIDPMGFLCSALFFVGWAKPVPVNPLNFKKYKRDMALVSVAGVLTNLAMAFVSCGFFTLIVRFGNYNNEFIFYLAQFFNISYTLNIALAVFNFLPVFPLDGFNFIDAITSANNKFVNFLRQYGSLILLVVLLLCSDFLSIIISWVSMPIYLFWGLIF